MAVQEYPPELGQELADLLDDPNEGDNIAALIRHDSENEEAKAKYSTVKKAKKRRGRKPRACKKWIHAGIYRGPGSETHQIWYGFELRKNQITKEKSLHICYAADKHGETLGNWGAGKGKRYMITFNEYLQDAWKRFLDANGAFAHRNVIRGEKAQRRSLLQKWLSDDFVDPYPDGNESLMIGPEINVIRPPDLNEDSDEEDNAITNYIPIRPAQLRVNCYPDSRIPLSTGKIKIGLYERWNMDALTVIEDFLRGRMAVNANANVPKYEDLQADRIESAFFHLGWRADWWGIRKANKHVRQKDVKFAVNSRSWTAHPPIQFDNHQRDSNRVQRLMRRLRDESPESHDLQDGEISSDDDDDDEDGNDVQVVSSKTRKRSRKDKPKEKKRSKRKAKKSKKKLAPKAKNSRQVAHEISDDEDEDPAVIDEFVNESDDLPGILPDSDTESEASGETDRMLAALNQQHRRRPTSPRSPPTGQFEDNENDNEMSVIDGFRIDEDDSDDCLFVNESPKPSRVINLTETKSAYLGSQSSKSPNPRKSQPQSPDSTQGADRSVQHEKDKFAMRTLLSNYNSVPSSQASPEPEVAQHSQVSPLIGKGCPSTHTDEEGDAEMGTPETQCTSSGDNQRKRTSQEPSDENGSPTKKVKKEGLAWLIKSEAGELIDLSYLNNSDDDNDDDDESFPRRGVIVPNGRPWKLGGSGHLDDPYNVD